MTLPRLITFFVPLPEPVALQDRMTLMFDEAGSSKLKAGIPIWIGPNIPKRDDGSGSNFVSLKVWQQASSMVQLQEQMRVASAVVHLETSLGTFDGVAPSIPATATVISAVTPLVGTEDPITEAFRLCLARINQVVAAYGLATRQSFAPVTEARLPMLIQYASRPADSSEFDQPGVTQLHANDVRRSMPAPPKDLNDVLHFVSELSVGGPRIAYMRLSAEARRHYDRNGDPLAAVVMAETACEVLLDGVLSLLLWEEGKTPQEAAAEVFLATESLAPRVKKYYAPRLGGTGWVLQGTGPVPTWYVAVAKLRNRCVHAGYVPSRDEAIAASVAERKLLEFIMERLRVKHRLYPRSAFILGAANDPGTDRLAEMRAFVAWQEALAIARE